MKKIVPLMLLALVLATSLRANPGFREDTVNWLKARGISPEGIVVIISMLPVIELRGAIPVGIFGFGFTWQKAALLSVFGNMLPIPLVLLFWESIVLLLRRTKRGARFVDWLYYRTKGRSKVIEKYEEIGLMLFVGIPLPGTGAWTGAFAANIIGLRFWKSLLFIFLGVLLAAAAVTILCQTGVLVFQI